MAPLTRVADVAVVVPVHDDAPALERLLARVAAWSTRPAEIVVAASGPDAAVERLCDLHGAKRVVCSVSRGAQLDAGARAAGASVLWFVQAQAEPPAGGLGAIAAAVAAGAESGCFEFRFQGPRGRRKRLIERLVGLRLALGGIAYGDQALFTTRAAYLDAGGFAHEPLFEEVRLVRRLRRRGTFTMIGLPAGVSTRRFERDGWLRRALLNRWLALRHLLGAPPNRLAAGYRAGRPPERLRDTEVSR